MLINVIIIVHNRVISATELETQSPLYTQRRVTPSYEAEKSGKAGNFLK